MSGDCRREAASGPAPGGAACPNCGDTTAGNYCPSCGQRRTERRISLRRMLAEVIEDQLSLNAALPRTLKALFLKPGLLSSEYAAGRVQRYIPPFRLYLAASVVFFLLLSLRGGLDPQVQLSGKSAATDSLGTSAQQGRDTISLRSLEAGDVVMFRTGWARFDSLGNRRVRELASLPPQEAANRLGDAMVRRAPTVMFLALPVFAALLALIYRRRRRYYVEHFVFGLHTHAFAFLLFALRLLLGHGRGWVAVPLLLWLVVYTCVALKRFYGGGWTGTIVRYLALGALYSVVFVVGMVATVTAALLLG